MKPREISDQLPNGFHGAVLESVISDYAKRTGEFRLKLLVPNGEAHGSKSRFRSGTFRIAELAFLAVDIPDPNYDFFRAETEIGSLLDTTSDICPQSTILRDQLGSSFFFHSFFVEDWNGFIHFAGKSARFDWNED